MYPACVVTGLCPVQVTVSSITAGGYSNLESAIEQHGRWFYMLDKNSGFVSGYRFSDTASLSISIAPLGAGAQNLTFPQPLHPLGPRTLHHHTNRSAIVCELVSINPVD